MIRATQFILLFVSVLQVACNHVQEDEAAIKALLEKEAATWRNGDHVAHASCWLVKPYSFIWVSTLEGKMIEVPIAAVIKHSGAAPGGSAVQRNFNIQINGARAWVTHDEISTDTLGQKTASAELRVLEKENGQWKLVGQSIHQKPLR